MSLRSQAVVVVPVYKETPGPSEQLAFDRCLQVLGRHPIMLIHPSGLKLDAYRVGAANVTARSFDPSFFRSTQTYNRLMMAPTFYASFLRYRYILIHQLDAFVFSDQLAHWCELGYDYVGAPWIGAPWLDQLPIRRPRWSRDNIVGNGGFSLRRTSSFLALALAFRRGAARWPANEDGFWAFYVKSWWPLFRIPSTDVALRFSFELNPRDCYERTGHVLPFGCHAWEKHDPAFWARFIGSATR